MRGCGEYVGNFAELVRGESQKIGTQRAPREGAQSSRRRKGRAGKCDDWTFDHSKWGSGGAGVRFPFWELACGQVVGQRACGGLDGRRFDARLMITQ
jgi:hypothetical protein